MKPITFEDGKFIYVHPVYGRIHSNGDGKWADDRGNTWDQQAAGITDGADGPAKEDGQP